LSNPPHPPLPDTGKSRGSKLERRPDERLIAKLVEGLFGGLEQALRGLESCRLCPVDEMLPGRAAQAVRWRTRPIRLSRGEP